MTYGIDVSGGGNLEQNKKTFEKLMEGKKLSDLELGDLSDILNQSSDLDISNSKHKELILNFLSKIKNKNDSKKLEIDGISSNLTSEGAAFRKILSLVKIATNKKDVQTNFLTHSDAELQLLQNWMDGKQEILSNSSDLAGLVKTDVKDKSSVRELSEGTTYNNISINSAIYSLKNGIENGKYTNIFVEFIQKLYSYSRMTLKTNGEQSFNNQYDVDSNDFKDFIKNSKYVFGASKFIDMEIRDLTSFMKNNLGEDFDSIINSNKSEVKVTRKTSLERYNKEGVLNDRKVSTFNSKDIGSLLDYISDLSGVDQGDKADGVLRGFNSKLYSNGFFGTIGRKMGIGGEWAQSEALSEIQVRKYLDSIKDIDSLKKLINQVVFIGEGIKKVDEAFNKPEDLKFLLNMFKDIILGRVSQIKNPSALTMTNDEYYKEVIADAEKKVKLLENLKSKISKSESFLGVRDKISSDLGEKNANDLLSSWTSAYLTNVEVYFGVNLLSVDETTINKIVDKAGNVLKESKIERTETSVNPYILIGFDIARFQTILGDKGYLKPYGSIKLNGIAGISGVGIPLTGNVGANYTLNDDNYPLKRDLKGNWVIGGSIGLGVDLLKGGTFELAGLDLNWNSKIDAIQNQLHLFKKILKSLIDDNGKIKSGGIGSTIDSLRTLGSSYSKEDLLQIKILEVNLTYLEKIFSKIDASNSPNKEDIKNNVLTTFISSSISEFNVALHKINTGVNISGLHFGIFSSNIFTLGLNIENIQGGYKGGDIVNILGKGQDDALKSFEKRYIINNGSVLEIDNFIEVIVDSKSEIIVEEKDGKKFIKSKDGKKINYKVLEIDNDIASTKAKIYVTTNKDTYEKNSDEKFADSVVKITSLDLKKAGIDLSNLKTRELSKTIYSGFRKGIGKGLEKLGDELESYLKNPSKGKDNLISEIEKNLGKILGEKNISTIKSMTTDELVHLAAIFMKFSWGDGTVIGKEKISFNSNKIKEEKRILLEEKDFLKTLTTTPIVDEISNGKESKLVPNKIYKKDNLSTSNWDVNSYSGTASMVVATPKNGKPRLVVMDGVNTEFYGDKVDVNGLETKNFMLDQLIYYVKEQLDKTNKSLNLHGNDKIGIDEYRNFLINGEISDKMKVLGISQEKSTRFLSFAAGFKGNECFNVGGTILFGKLKRVVNGKDITVSSPRVTDRIGVPVTDNSSITIGLSGARQNVDSRETSGSHGQVGGGTGAKPAPAPNLSLGEQ